MKKVYLDDCGVYLWWYKFLQKAFSGRGLPLSEVLAPYNCRYVCNPGFFDDDDYLEFETEHDYVMFVLRWS